MLARLIDMRKISETDKIGHFYKELKGQKTGQISLLDLTTHRSGLPRLPCNLDWTPDPSQPYKNYNEKNYIDGLKDSSFNEECKLQDRPTSTIDYSNWGVAILGNILASQQKKSYEKILHELILDPLNLTSTKVKLDRVLQKKAATGHDVDLNQVPSWEETKFTGAGFIKSSAKDMIKYAQAYIHPEKYPFESSLINASKSHYITKEEFAIGYGWFVKKSGSMWHDGGTGGFSSLMKIYPKRDLAVVILTNTSSPLKCALEALEEYPCEP